MLLDVPTRRIVPHRRPSTTIDAEWQGHRITIGIGFYPDTGEIAEVFADVERGGHMQATLSDACVLISIALQHGHTLPTLSKSLAVMPDFAGHEIPASPIGAILTALAEMEVKE